MNSLKVTVTIVIILVSVTNINIMCAAIRDTHDYDYAETVKEVAVNRAEKHSKNGLRKDSNDRQIAARRRSDTHKSHSDTPFYFYRDGFEHFHPPVAIFGWAKGAILINGGYYLNTFQYWLADDEKEGVQLADSKVSSSPVWSKKDNLDVCWTFLDIFVRP